MAYNRLIEATQPPHRKGRDGKLIPTPLQSHLDANRSIAAERLGVKEPRCAK